MVILVADGIGSKINHIDVVVMIRSVFSLWWAVFICEVAKPLWVG